MRRISHVQYGPLRRSVASALLVPRDLCGCHNVDIYLLHMVVPKNPTGPQRDRQARELHFVTGTAAHAFNRGGTQFLTKWENNILSIYSVSKSKCTVNICRRRFCSSRPASTNRPGHHHEMRPQSCREAVPGFTHPPGRQPPTPISHPEVHQTLRGSPQITVSTRAKRIVHRSGKR